MATYTHFAKQPDVLKHLILCEVLRNEAPQVYVETNSACAIYSMTQTPEQQYGIYHFLEKADDDKSLKDSIYYQLENPEDQKEIIWVLLPGNECIREASKKVCIL